MHILTVTVEERIQHASLGNGLPVSRICPASAVLVFTITMGHHATLFKKFHADDALCCVTRFEMLWLISAIRENTHEYSRPLFALCFVDARGLRC
jgi:hypothetical protein